MIMLRVLMISRLILLRGHLLRHAFLRTKKENNKKAKKDLTNKIKRDIILIRYGHLTVRLLTAGKFEFLMLAVLSP